MVTAHSEKIIHVWNLENIFNGGFDPIYVKESPLKHGTSSICCFADAKGFAVGSIEGRIGVVNINSFSTVDRVEKAYFCFKCHRVEE